MKRWIVEKLDAAGHFIGWVPRWLCDLHDYLITGEHIP